MADLQSRPLGGRLREVIEEPFGEAWRSPLIEASVFFTFTFHRQEFEELLLPELYGLPTEGERSARLSLLQLQLAPAPPLVIHDARLPVELDDEGKPVPSAKLASAASFRLDTVPVRWNNGACMHAKHALLRVRCADSHLRGSSEAMIVVTTSANLTRAGWRENVELGDIQVLQPGQMTPLKPGLIELLADAADWAQSAHGRSEALPTSLKHVTSFVEGLVEPTGDAPRLPRLWTGREPLEDAIKTAAKALKLRSIRRLSVGAPYMSADAAPIKRLNRSLKPDRIHVMRPFDNQGSPLSLPEWEVAVTEMSGRSGQATLHQLVNYEPTPKLDSTSKRRPGRTTHLKWVFARGKKGGLLVLGSPNLSDQAFGPNTQPGCNYETAILLPVDKRLRLLATEALEPHAHVPSVAAALEPNNLADVPSFHLLCDWAQPEAQRVSLVGQAPSPGTLLRRFGGEGGTPLDVDSVHHRLGETTGAVVLEALREQSAVLEVLEPSRGEEPRLYHVLVVEINQVHAPPRARFGITVDQYLRLAIAAGLEDWTRAEAEADQLDRMRMEEEESIGASSSTRPSLELDRPILIIQAMMQLEDQIRVALGDDDKAAVERLLYDRQGVSLRGVVERHLPPQGSDREPSAVSEVDALVCWLCAKSLVNSLDVGDPSAKHNELASLISTLGKGWEQLSGDDGYPMPDRIKLRDWMLANWRGPVSECSRVDCSEPQEASHDR